MFQAYLVLIMTDVPCIAGPPYTLILEIIVGWWFWDINLVTFTIIKVSQQKDLICLKDEIILKKGLNCINKCHAELDQLRGWKEPQWLIADNAY